MADRRRPIPSRDSECESEGNPNEDLSEYESAPEENKDGTRVEQEEESSETDDDDDEEGETSEEETEDGDYTDDVIVEEERQSGDGQEQPELNEDDLDDDEDKKNPAYVPRKGAFYEHDLRIEEESEGNVETETKEERPKKKLWKDDVKWIHDRFSESQQAPKSREELVALYGYDIRSHDKPPDRPPKMDRRRQGNPRERPNELGDYISDRPARYNRSAGRGSNYEDRNQQEHYNNNDDRPQYDNNRQQFKRGREESPRYDKRRENDSYQNRQNSYNDARRGRNYHSLKDNGEGHGYSGNRTEYQKQNNMNRNEHEDSRPQQGSQTKQDVRYQESGDVRQHQNNGRKFQERNQGNIREQDANTEYRERRGPEHGSKWPDRDTRRSNKEFKGQERDNRATNRAAEQGYKGPERINQDPHRDNRGPDRGPQSRTQGGRGPRLQRGGHHTSGVRNDSRENPGSFSERSSETFPRQFTNSAYKESQGVDAETEEASNSETIQINVVNKTALLDRKSYSRERRGRAIGRTRVQEGQGFSMDQSLYQQEPASQTREEQGQAVANSQPLPGQEMKYQPNQTVQGTTGTQDVKSYPPQPVVKQEAGQTRPKRYSTQRQRGMPDTQYPEQTVSPVENTAFFNQGFRPAAPMFRAEHPAQAGPRPRQKAPFPQPTILRAPLHYPVPVSTAGLSTPRPLYAGGPPVSIPAGQPLISPQYMPTGMIYGPPPYQIPAPVPVQNFTSPPPVPVQVQQPVQLPAQPSPSEVCRGGTTYYPPQYQPSIPNRSPVRRQKLAIPIIRPQESQGEEHYYLREHQDMMYAEGEEPEYQEAESYTYQEVEPYQESPTATDQTNQFSSHEETPNSQAPPPVEIDKSVAQSYESFSHSNNEVAPPVDIDNHAAESVEPQMSDENLTQNTQDGHSLGNDPVASQQALIVTESGDKQQPSSVPVSPVEDASNQVLLQELKPEPRTPELKPEPRNSELNPEPLAPELNPEPLAPELKPEPRAPELKPEPRAPELNPEPRAAELKPDQWAPELKSDPQAPELKHEPRAPELKHEPRASELKRESQVPELKPEPRAQEIKPEPRAPVESGDPNIAAAGDNNQDITESKSDQNDETSSMAEFSPETGSVFKEKSEETSIETESSESLSAIETTQSS